MGTPLHPENRSVLNAIRACYLCKSNDKTVRPCPGPLQPVPLTDGPWQKVAIDIVGPFETATLESKFAIKMGDYDSKWTEIAFVRDPTTGSVLTFMSTMFSCHRNPLRLVTDNGAQLTSPSFTSFLQERQITHNIGLQSTTQLPAEPLNS